MNSMDWEGSWEAAGLPEMFSVWKWVEATRTHTHIKIHQAVYLRVVHFMHSTGCEEKMTKTPVPTHPTI